MGEILRSLGVPNLWERSIKLDLPLGVFKYASMGFAKSQLPQLSDLFEELSVGIDDPKITYRFQHLEAGEQFGHGRFHFDGMGHESEIHRLITHLGEPTLGFDGRILTAGTLWEFNGPYLHRAQPTSQICDRLLIRISRTNLRYRNKWE